MGVTPPSQDRTPQQIADDEAEEQERREQIAFNKKERQREDIRIAEAEAKLVKEKGLTESRKAQEISARARNLRGFPSLLGGGGFTGFTLEGDIERLRRAGLTAAEQKRVAAEEAERQRLAAEEAERKRLADAAAAAAAERQRKDEAAKTQAATIKAASFGSPLLASKDPQVVAEEALRLGTPLLASKDPQTKAEAELRTGLAGGLAEGQRTSRQRAEEIVKTKLIAGGFDPDDPTKTLGGEDLTPLEVQKRIKATSFTGVNPPSLFDEFDPSNALVRLGPAPTSRQRQEAIDEINLIAGGFDPDDPTKSLTGEDLTPTQVQTRIKATSFKGFNPPSMFDEFDPSNALASIVPTLTSRQRADEAVRVDLISRGFDPDDPTKTLDGRTLSPFGVQQRLGSQSVGPDSTISTPKEVEFTPSTFDPKKSLARLGPSPTSRQRQDEKVKLALHAAGFDPDDDTKTVDGKPLTSLQVQQRIRVVNEA